MSIRKKKNLKPIDTDVHLKYRCPNEDCGSLHWLSLKESQTKNFKIVCDCGSVFTPKRVKNININYCQITSNNTDQTADEQQKIDLDLIKNCVTILVGYGFTNQESEEILIKSHRQNPKLGSVELIKFALQSIGG
jgi:hypothetical protein